MPQQFSDDLFEGTKMTFGEHLEELRVCLFRGVIGLVIGLLIGFAFAKPVVRWVKGPLQRALEEHYMGRTIDRLTTEYSELSEERRKELVQFVREYHLTYDTVFLDRRGVERALAAGDSARRRSAEGSEEEETLDPLTTQLPPPDLKYLVKTHLWRRLDPRITTLNAQEAFMIWLKAAFVTGLLIASPYILWELWKFIAAGLYPHEKKYVYLFLPISLVLFWGGAAMAFFVVFRYVLNFLLEFNAALEIHSEPRISEWISFVLILPLGFGIAFQLPLAMLFLQRIGILSIQAYLSKWRISVLVICVISMLLTPADPISMVLMAAPLTALYFLGIAFCKYMPRGRSPFAEAYEP